jgi:hypothetical protein
MDGMDGVRVVCDASQRRLRKSFFFLSLGSWKGSLKARAKVSLWSGARAENVVDPRFVADENPNKARCFHSLILRRDLCTQVAIHRKGVTLLCFKGAKVRAGAERGFTRPCVDAHSYRLGASPKLSGPLASAPTSRAPVQLRRAFEPGRCLPVV